MKGSIAGKGVLILALISLTLFASAGGAMAGIQSSANYRITTSVLSGGGGAATSTPSGDVLSHTLGQPSPPGPATAAGGDLYSGFWHTVPLAVDLTATLTPVYLLLLLQ